MYSQLCNPLSMKDGIVLMQSWKWGSAQKAVYNKYQESGWMGGLTKKSNVKTEITFMITNLMQLIHSILHKATTGIVCNLT